MQVYNGTRLAPSSEGPMGVGESAVNHRKSKAFHGLSRQRNLFAS